MTQIKITNQSWSDLVKTVKAKLLFPKLKKITSGLQSNIATVAKPYKGVSGLSISNKSATYKTINKINLSSNIKPIVSKAGIFKINIEGYDTDIYKNVSENSELQAWVQQKYYDPTATIIRVRSRVEAGDPAPLGSIERDFFNIAVNKLITSQKNQYGLK